MKQNLIALFAILLAATSYGQGSKVTGFRDLVWGAHSDSVYSNGARLKFVKDRDAGAANAYTLDNDNLVLGAAKLTKINYFFNTDNRFKKVVLHGKEKYFKDVKDIVVFKFGGPKNKKEVSSNLRVLEWQVGDVSINLTQDIREESFSLIIESNWDLTQGYLANMNVTDIVYDGKKVIGFRNFKWLDKKDSIYHNGERVQFELDNKASQPNTYYLQSEKLVFGSARLQGISYVFNEDDKLNKVVLMGSKEYYDDVKFILNHKFGGAGDVNIFGNELSVNEWTVGDTSMKLTESGAGDEFSLIIESSRDKTESYIKNRNVSDF